MEKEIFFLNENRIQVREDAVKGPADSEGLEPQFETLDNLGKIVCEDRVGEVGG